MQANLCNFFKKIGLRTGSLIFCLSQNDQFSSPLVSSERTFETTCLTGQGSYSRSPSFSIYTSPLAPSWKSAPLCLPLMLQSAPVTLVSYLHSYALLPFFEYFLYYVVKESEKQCKEKEKLHNIISLFISIFKIFSFFVL